MLLVLHAETGDEACAGLVEIHHVRDQGDNGDEAEHDRRQHHRDPTVNAVGRRDHDAVLSRVPNRHGVPFLESVTFCLKADTHP